jgi:hypothetical protein
MIVKLTKVVKSLLQIVSHQVRIETARADDKASRLQKLFEWMVDDVCHLSLDLITKLGQDNANWSCCFVSLDQDEDELSANPYLLNTEKLRDFELGEHMYQEWFEVLEPFYGKWIVTDRRDTEHYSRTHIDISKESAPSSCVVSEIVRVLSSSKDKCLVRAQELLELPAGSGALKDKRFISGYLWVMMKAKSDDHYGKAYISRFVIDLKTGTGSKGSGRVVTIEDRSRERKITNNRSDRGYDDLER